MNRHPRPVALALFALIVLVAASVMALPIPPRPTAWVTDGAGILSAEQQQALNQKLETLKQNTGTEFLIMTFPSLEGEEVVDYTNRVANMWKVKDDKAVMLFVFLKERKTWIQVGYGLEGVITDAYSSRVYREILVPNFRAGKYYEGLNAAIDALATKIDPNALRGTVAQKQPALPPGGDGGVAGSIIPIIIVLVFIFFILPMFTRRRGGCGGCFWPLFFMGGGGGTTFGGGGGGGGGGWNVGGSWGGGGSSFGGGGAGGGW